MVPRFRGKHMLLTFRSRAAAIGTTWRISNDISNNWESIWRITNEVVPYYKYTAPGQYPDMDMLM